MFAPRTRLNPLVFCLVCSAALPSAVMAQTTDVSQTTSTPSAAATSTRDAFDAVGDDVIAAVTAEVTIATQTPTDASVAWDLVQQGGTKEDVFAFIETYPNSPQAKYAKALMIDLLWTEIAAADAAPVVVEDTPVATPVAAVTTTEVELVSTDGFVSVVGEIVSFDADLISIKTSYGTVGIPNVDINCIGATCPAGL